MLSRVILLCYPIFGEHIFIGGMGRYLWGMNPPGCEPLILANFFKCGLHICFANGQSVIHKKLNPPTFVNEFV